MKTQEEVIRELVDNLDYHKIQRVMETLGWTYHGHKNTPSITELRDKARQVAEGVVIGTEYTPKEWTYSRTGGFVGTRFGEWPECYLNLAFVVNDCDICLPEED